MRETHEQGTKPAEMTYMLVFEPIGTPLEEMVEAFGARWTVEQCFEEGKGEVCLDEYEVRSWHGWYRHVTLSMLALSFLTVLRANEGSSSHCISEKVLDLSPCRESLKNSSYQVGYALR